MEVTQELLDYFNNDNLAATVWLTKYAAEGERTPEDMHRRMAKEFARIERKYSNLGTVPSRTTSSHYMKELSEEYIFELFHKFKYVIPAGSIMANLGTDTPTSLSNCFVIDSPEDSYSSIMKAREEQVHLMKRRGGVGYDLSKLRPKGAKVNNAAKTSTGAASFMDVCSDLTNEVAQNGRRGALMLSMDVRHPDIEEFISKKQDLIKITGANISVQVTNAFMDAVRDDADFLLYYPLDSELIKDIKLGEVPYNEFCTITDSNNKEKAYFKKIKAKELWDLLMHCAWNTAEPGIIFKDRMIDFAPDGVYKKYQMICTNPCSEIGMGAYDSCRLMHLNLTSFVIDPYTTNARFDYDLFQKIAYITLRLADNLVDLEIEQIDKILDNAENGTEKDLWLRIKDTTESGRRTGVGFTGLADTLAMCNLPFSSNSTTLEFIRRIMRTKFTAEVYCTTDLAVSRGAFPDHSRTLEAISGNDWYSFLKISENHLYRRLIEYGRRNISWSTVAPTGTVSLLAGTSSGIEPVFMPIYERKVKCTTDEDRVDFIDDVGEKYTIYPVIHKGLKDYIWANRDSILFEDIVEEEDFDKLSIEDWKEYYSHTPYYGSTSSDVSWRDRNTIQSIVQTYTTHSISSTINLPEETTLDEIKDIYMDAFMLGNKGQTIYRDNCRAGVLTSIKDKPDEIAYTSAPKRPKELEAIYHQVKVKGETFIIIVGFLNERPYEIFAFRPLNDIVIPKHSGTIIKKKKMHYSFVSDNLTIDNLELKNDNIEEKAATLYSSMLLRHGVDIEYIIKTAKKVNNNISSFSSAMCRVLAEYTATGKVKGEVCPECGGDLLREAGCIRCKDCSYSKCE